MVGARGFEPPTPRSPNRVLYQAEPRPDAIPAFYPTSGGRAHRRFDKGCSPFPPMPAPRDATPFDAVLLISFGGPTGRADIRPFLQNVLRGRRVPPARIEEVAHHYELFDGRSPLTAITRRQADGLRERLRPAGRTCRCSWECATGTRSSTTRWLKWRRRASSGARHRARRATTATRAAGSTARTSPRRDGRCGRRERPTSRCSSHPDGTPTKGSSKPTPGRFALLSAIFPRTRGDPPGLSSPPTASRRRWLPHAATKWSCARRPRSWPSASGPTTGRSSTRAGAGGPPIPGSGRTSATTCARRTPAGCARR